MINMQIENEQIKRLVVCCDGTWQGPDNDCPTNVLKIAQAVEPVAKDKNGNEIAQVLYYDEGIGTDENADEDGGIAGTVDYIKKFAEKVGGGAFGWWIGNKLKEAYIFLCLNYTPGDEIYLFGFSRGAYTVRSLAGLINCSGLLQRPDISKSSQAYKIYRIADAEKRKKEADKFRQENNIKQVPIKLLGCWDTVGALGVPDFIPWFKLDNILNKKYQFHNTNLSPIIQNARHAIAVDEKRKAFNVTYMKPGQGFNGDIKEMWFPGDHGCVGGGTKETLKLSNAALKWMVDEASKLGLEVNLELSQDDFEIDHTAPFSNKSELGDLGMDDRAIVGFNFDNLHISVKRRWRDLGNYRPANLECLAQELNDWNE
jgi:uncharacterized protein (DUF2235 family)